MRRITTAMWCGLAGVSTIVGCASGPRESYQTQSRLITLHTQPEGASVTVFGPMGGSTQVGTTPLTDQPVMVLSGFKASFADPASGYNMMSRLNAAQVRIEKNGYEPWEGSIATSPTSTVERTIVLTPTTRPATP